MAAWLGVCGVDLLQALLKCYRYYNYYCYLYNYYYYSYHHHHHHHHHYAAVMQASSIFRKPTLPIQLLRPLPPPPLLLLWLLIILRIILRIILLMLLLLLLPMLLLLILLPLLLPTNTAEIQASLIFRKPHRRHRSVIWGIRGRRSGR